MYEFDYWWDSEKDDMHERILPLAKHIIDSTDRHEALARWLSRLTNRHYASLKPGEFNARPASEGGEGMNDVTVVLNTIQNIYDTQTSHICVHRPRPRFLTVDGNWELRRTAKRLQRFAEGVAQITEAYQETTKAFADCIWSGTGFVKIYGWDNQIHCERVFPNEILVDERSAMDTKPRVMLQQKYAAAEVIMAMFPDKKAEIAEVVTKGDGEVSEGNIITTDLVEVVEAWHLPSKEGGDDGRHVICIDGATLYDGDWTRKEFPFAVCRYARLPRGYYGQSMVERQWPLQHQKNKLLQRIADCMQLFAGVNIIAEKGSINADSITNEPGIIIWKKPGSPDPKVHTPASISSQVFGHVDWLDGKQYEVEGVSRLSATGQKPPGDLSGIALRTLQDVETRRGGLLGQTWDQLHLDVWRRIVDAARELYSEGDDATDYEVKYGEKDFFQCIKWSDVNLDRDAYRLELWPTNILPSEPSGKLAVIQEFMQADMIDKDVGMALLDFPDLDQAMSLQTAVIDSIDATLEKMFSDKKYTPPAAAFSNYQGPEQAHELTLGIGRMCHEKLRSAVDGAPDEVLELIQTWIDEAGALLLDIRAQIAQPPGPPGAPPGPPGPPPGAPPPPMPPGGLPPIA